MLKNDKESPHHTHTDAQNTYVHAHTARACTHTHMHNTTYTPTEHTDMYNTHNIHACRNIHAYTQHIHIHNIYTYYWLVEYYYQSNILLDSRVLLYLY